MLATLKERIREDRFPNAECSLTERFKVACGVAEAVFFCLTADFFTGYHILKHLHIYDSLDRSLG